MFEERRVCHKFDRAEHESPGAIPSKRQEDRGSKANHDDTGRMDMPDDATPKSASHAVRGKSNHRNDDAIGRRQIVLRAALTTLAFLHAFPATKHMGAFVQRPSLDEAWKGIGASLAVVLYLLPLRVYARGLGVLWARRRLVLVLGGWALAVVHAVPASDHLPRFFAHPTWGDAWRGLGATLACAWFLAPLRAQAVLVRAMRVDTLVSGGKAWMGRAKVAVVVLLGVLLGGALGARAVARSATSSVSPVARETSVERAALPSNELRVPRAVSAIVVDGDVDEAAWANAARTEAFRSNGAPSRPYSDARVSWRDGQLFIALYAADEDIRAATARHDDPLWLTDAFQLSFAYAGREHVVDVSPVGVVTDGERRLPDGKIDFRWESEALVGHEEDGTLNAPDDDDEEWVIEIAIPLSRLGLVGRPGERIGFSARRCDVTRQIGRVCAGWGERGDSVLVLME